MGLRCVLQVDPGVVCNEPAVAFYKFNPPSTSFGSVMAVCKRCQEDGWHFAAGDPVRMTPEEEAILVVLES